jgi:hypothetical protein
VYLVTNRGPNWPLVTGVLVVCQPAHATSLNTGSVLCKRVRASLAVTELAKTENG